MGEGARLNEGRGIDNLAATEGLELQRGRLYVDESVMTNATKTRILTSSLRSSTPSIALTAPFTIYAPYESDIIKTLPRISVDVTVFNNGRDLSEDLVIRVQPSQGEIQLPVSTIDWQSNPRGQFILVQGLDFLIGVSRLLIQQTVELHDLTARIDSENRYIVRVPNGEALFIANETSSSTQRCLCGSGRAFTMRLHDNTRQEALVLERRLASASCCFPCRLQEMLVTTPPGDYVGRIQQQWTCMVPFFLVRDANDVVLFVLEGPAVLWKRSLILSEFRIMTGDSLREVGKIVHGWDRELVSFTTTLQLPNVAVQPKHKALLLAASFLLEYTYFEKSKSSCRMCSCC